MTKKTFKPDFVVNYGVNDSHRLMNCKLCSRYKDALAFYRDEVDRDRWPSGEIVRLEYDCAGYVQRRTRKDAYSAGHELTLPSAGVDIPMGCAV